MGRFYDLKLNSQVRGREARVTRVRRLGRSC